MSDCKPKIYFLGAGTFAIPALDVLRKSTGIHLVGVGTQPDKPAGRKRILTPSPLGQWADENDVECERITSVNTEEFLRKIGILAPDMLIVVSFGQILKESVLRSAPFGCMNIHASILPKYRGASPITTAVLNGDTISGVSFMQMERGLDTGPVYEIHTMDLPTDIDTGMLERHLAYLAGERLEACIHRVIGRQIKPCPQNHDVATLSRKIKKSDGLVDWSEDAALIDRKVRAFRDWPSVSFRIRPPRQEREINVKIRLASYTSWSPGSGEPGKFVAYTNNKMMIACGKGALLIERLLPEGKKEMSVADFLNGCRLSVGDMLLNGADSSAVQKQE